MRILSAHRRDQHWRARLYLQPSLHRDWQANSAFRLIAIMLGRLRMDIDTCIEKYLLLSSEAFQPKRSKVDILRRAKDVWNAEGAYRAECLTAQIKAVAQSFAGDENAKLLDPEPSTSCKM